MATVQSEAIKSLTRLIDTLTKHRGLKHTEIDDTTHRDASALIKEPSFKLKSVVSYFCDSICHINAQQQHTLTYALSAVTDLICKFCGALELTFDTKSCNPCNICMVESLDVKQCIKLNCNHSFHLECVLKIYQINIAAMQQNGKHISFLPFTCPLCKKPMKHSKLKHMNLNLNILRKKILIKGTMRLKYDNIFHDNDTEHLDTTQIMDLIMNNYTYYHCNKCKQPYFGGKTECVCNNIRVEGNDAKLCNKCRPIKENRHCSIAGHGDLYIVWKCRFCCNVSKWYCWGSTHLCDGCHLNRNQLIRQYGARKLMQCPSAAPLINSAANKFKHRYLPKKLQLDCCPLGIKHGPQGIEFALGCALCNDFKYSTVFS